MLAENGPIFLQDCNIPFSQSHIPLENTPSVQKRKKKRIPSYEPGHITHLSRFIATHLSTFFFWERIERYWAYHTRNSTGARSSGKLLPGWHTPRSHRSSQRPSTPMHSCSYSKGLGSCTKMLETFGQFGICWGHFLDSFAVVAWLKNVINI